MRVLVTGLLGTHGRWIAERLLEDGHTLTGVDVQDGTGTLGALADEIELLQADLRDPEAVARTFAARNFDVVVHTAAILSRHANNDPSLAIAVNVGGTLNVLQAAAAADVGRVVYSSSIVALAPFIGAAGYPTYTPVGEDWPCAPVPPFRVYGATKRLAEQLGAHYHERDGPEFVALRYAAAILAPPIASRQTFAIAAPQVRMIEDALAGKAFVLEQGGDERTDLVYVKDLANAISAAARAPADPSGAYHIGSGRLSSFHDLAAAVDRQIAGARSTIGPGRDPLGIGDYYCAFDLTRARTLLGYEPRFVELDAVVADYVASRA
jgi:UDP-glucose 4-epimerase